MEGGGGGEKQERRGGVCVCVQRDEVEREQSRRRWGQGE